MAFGFSFVFAWCRIASNDCFGPKGDVFDLLHRWSLHDGLRSSLVAAARKGWLPLRHQHSQVEGSWSGDEEALLEGMMRMMERVDAIHD